MAKKITEQESLHNGLEHLSTLELLQGINSEDQKVAFAVQECLPQIEALINAAFPLMKNGGRLFYLGAGTSGRLGVVDASECPPTFGVDFNKVIGLIAGGDKAIRKAVEFAEDNTELGWEDLSKHNVSANDVVVGIAASGTTPYVVGALQKAREKGITTACITNNPDTPIVHQSDYPVEVNVGPEFVTGSTRMKSGTSQKMVLNMLSTSLMIKLGHVKGNRMVDMQLSNKKLVERGTHMIMSSLEISYEEANELLLKYGSVRKALEANT